MSIRYASSFNINTYGSRITIAETKANMEAALSEKFERFTILEWKEEIQDGKTLVTCKFESGREWIKLEHNCTEEEKVFPIKGEIVREENGEEHQSWYFRGHLINFCPFCGKYLFEQGD